MRASDILGSLGSRAEQVRHRVDQARHQARNVAREMSRNLARARAEAEASMQSLGLPMNQGPVIDVGTRPSAISRAGSAVAAAALALLIAGSLLSFSAFLFQFLLATLIASRILGLNLDLGAMGAQARS